ncbi:MAG: hypothetical protein ACOX22_01865 [Caldicoprobacterales bacterium]|jgi:hypothetical protein
MPKNKKEKSKKSNKQQTAFYNDQLGENASEQFAKGYDNKQANKK